MLTNGTIKSFNGAARNSAPNAPTFTLTSEGMGATRYCRFFGDISGNEQMQKLVSQDHVEITTIDRIIDAGYQVQGTKWLDHKNNMPIGLFEERHDNHQLAMRGSYDKNNKPRGLFEKWYRNGQKHEESYYNENGRLHGDCREWDESGNLSESVRYNDGEPDGLFRTRDDDGNEKQEFLYQNGDELMKFKTYKSYVEYKGAEMDKRREISEPEPS